MLQHVVVDRDDDCPGCNVHFDLTDLARRRRGRPTCPTARTTAGSPTSASCRSTSSRSLRFTVQSCNREVFAMTPDGVERNEPGAWDFTLAAIAHELNERFGPPLPSRCKVH